MNSREPKRSSRLHDVNGAWDIDAERELQRFHDRREHVLGVRRVWERPRLIAVGAVAVVVFVVAGLLVANRSTDGSTTRANTPPNPSGQQVAPGPGGGNLGQVVRPGSSLSAIDGSGEHDVWAVGETHGRSAREHSLVLHFDGSTWRQAQVPDVGGLIGVSVVSTTDAWALGYNGLLHWDGSSWTASDLPHGNYMSISASGPDDVWIAGVRVGPLIGKNTRGLSSAVAHFDGTTWATMKPPNPGTRDNYIEGIVAASPTDVWLGGYYTDVGKHQPEALSLTMHWNGTKWSVVPSPNPSATLNVIWGIGADGQGGVWALGHYRGSDKHLHALIFRWDGSSWAIVPLRGTSLWSPQAVAGASSGPTWVVGSPSTSSFAIAECSAASCTTTVPPADRSAGEAASVFAAGPDDAWVAGVLWGRRASPWMEHWDGTEWSPVRVPNPTR